MNPLIEYLQNYSKSGNFDEKQEEKIFKYLTNQADYSTVADLFLDMTGDKYDELTVYDEAPPFRYELTSEINNTGVIKMMPILKNLIYILHNISVAIELDFLMQLFQLCGYSYDVLNAIDNGSDYMMMGFIYRCCYYSFRSNVYIISSFLEYAEEQNIKSDETNSVLSTLDKMYQLYPNSFDFFLNHHFFLNVTGMITGFFAYREIKSNSKEDKWQKMGDKFLDENGDDSTLRNSYLIGGGIYTETGRKFLSDISSMDEDEKYDPNELSNYIYEEQVYREMCCEKFNGRENDSSRAEGYNDTIDILSEYVREFKINPTAIFKISKFGGQQMSIKKRTLQYEEEFPGTMYEIAKTFNIPLEEPSKVFFASNILWEKGEHLELTENGLEYIIYKIFSGLDDVYKDSEYVELIKDWFKGDGNYQDIEDIANNIKDRELKEQLRSNYYNIYKIVIFLYGHSEYYEKLLKYRIAFDYYVSINVLFRNLIEYYDISLDDTYKDIYELDIPADVKIKTFLNLDNQRKNFYIDQFSDKDYEDAFKILSANDRKTLLQIILAGTIHYTGKEIFLMAVGSNSKHLRDIAKTYIIEHKECEADIKKMINSKKKVERESANEILAIWNRDENGDDYALQREHIRSTCNTTIAPIRKNSIKYIKLADLPKVRYKNTEELVEKEVMGYYIGEYSDIYQDDTDFLKEIRSYLNSDDMENVSEYMYEAIMDNGAKPKDRGMLKFVVVHAGDKLIDTLKKDVTRFLKEKRSSMAYIIISGFGRNKNKKAKQYLNDMSFSNKSDAMRRSCQNALKKSATYFSLDYNKMMDDLIPSLDFEQNGEKYIDYGNREIKLTLMPSLEIKIENEDGKVFKNLPKANAKDDAQKVEKAKNDLKEIKVSLKNVISAQSSRLEDVMIVEYSWDIKRWKEIFIKNPIMHYFATSLIWVCESGDDKVQFRYLDDGSFTNENEEDVVLPEDGKIYILHRICFSEDEVEKWSTQLSDYEIEQPFSQLDRPYKLIDDSIKDKTLIDEYKDISVTNRTLYFELSNSGWNYMDIDGKELNGMGRYFPSQKLLAFIDAIDTQYYYYSEPIYIPSVKFYKSDSESPKELGESIKLRDVNETIYSEISINIEKILNKK